MKGLSQRDYTNPMSDHRYKFTHRIPKNILSDINGKDFLEVKKSTQHPI